MLKRSFNYLLLGFFSLFCLNMSQAQNNAAGVIISPAPAPAPSATPTGGTSSSGTSTAAPSTSPANVLSQTLGSIGAAPPLSADVSVGKYEEYQSICRTNDYDLVKDLTDDVKKRRVELLNEKISQNGSEDSVKLKFRLIKEYIDQKNVAPTAALIDALKLLKLSTSDNEYLNALVAYTKNNVSLARSILNKMAIAKPDNIEVMRLLAEVYTVEGNYYEAATLYEDLNKITRSSYLPQLCEVMVINSLNADGEKACQQAIAKFPDNPFPHIFLGITYREREEMSKSTQAFKKSIAIRPTEMGYACAGEIFFIKEKWAEAIEEFKKGLEVNPKSIRSLLALAWSNLKLKNYTESLDAFKRACKVNAKFQSELRRAYKTLSADKIPEASKFFTAAESCGGN